MEVSSTIQDGSFFNSNFLPLGDNAPMPKVDRSPFQPALVAERLEALRYATGLSKGEFADTAGIDRSSYSKILKAEKPLKIEMGLDVSIRWGVSLEYIYKGQLSGLPPQFESTIRTHLTPGRP